MGSTSPARTLCGFSAGKRLYFGAIVASNGASWRIKAWIWSGSSVGVGGAAHGATFVNAGDADSGVTAGVGVGADVGAGACDIAILALLVLQSPLYHG